MKNLFSFLLAVLMFIYTNQTFSQESNSGSQLDPKVILGKYVDAIGGKDSLVKVTDRTTIMRGTAMGQNITIIVKQKVPNKLRQEVKAGGMEQVVIFDGTKGVMTVMDQKIDVKDKELEALKAEADMNFVFDPESFGAKITYAGADTVNGKQLQKVKMELPSGTKWVEFFDSETGLKVKEEREIDTQMGPGIQTITFDDYQSVDGVKYPFKISQAFGGQSLDMTVSSIKINKGLTDDIFVIAE